MMKEKRTIPMILREVAQLDEVQCTTEYVEILNKLATQIENRNANKKATPTQIENEKIKEVIIETLSNLDKSVSINDLQKINESLAVYSNQKISALLTQLLKANIIKRTEVKGKAFFEIVR